MRVQPTNAGIYSIIRPKDITQITTPLSAASKSLRTTTKQMGAFTKMLDDEAHLYPRESDSMLDKFSKKAGLHRRFSV